LTCFDAFERADAVIFPQVFFFDESFADKHKRKRNRLSKDFNDSNTAEIASATLNRMTYTAILNSEKASWLFL
jgi:hypothetical protein